MRNAARWIVGVLAAVMQCAVAEPVEAALFGRRFHRQRSRTFRPLQKLKQVQKVKNIRRAFSGSSGSSRTVSRRRTYRRSRVVGRG